MANLNSTPHRCHPILVIFVWELTEETISLPLGYLMGGPDKKCEEVTHVKRVWEQRAHRVREELRGDIRERLVQFISALRARLLSGKRVHNGIPT